MSTAINEGGVWVAVRRTGKQTSSGRTVAPWILVSPEDVDAVKSRLRWEQVSQGEYLRFSTPGQPKEWVHHFIAKRMGLNIGDGMVVDHINRKVFDNRRENIRVATRTQNSQNRKPIGKSGVRGVYWFQNRYVAMVRVDNNLVYLGRFKDKDEAARVALEYRLKHLPFAVD